MRFTAGDRMKLFMETAEGDVAEITGMVTSMSVSLGYDSGLRTELTIVGVPEWTSGVSITARRHAPEWKCDHCGRVNKMARTTCEGCGASRSFIYGP